tara:strand:+ start:1262 stop:1486 length:225 start_codon:yes stop_codon:yes gene_type:complete
MVCTNKKKINDALYGALMAHYESQRIEAKAILEVYFNNPVGIGEHSNILEEMKKWTVKLAEAEEAAATLERNFA